MFKCSTPGRNGDVCNFVKQNKGRNLTLRCLHGFIIFCTRKKLIWHKKLPFKGVKVNKSQVWNSCNTIYSCSLKFNTLSSDCKIRDGKSLANMCAFRKRFLKIDKFCLMTRYKLINTLNINWLSYIYINCF